MCIQGGCWLITLSMFLAYVAVYSQRSHLGITLIAMLNSTFVVHHQQQHEPEVNLTRRRADCKPFPRRDDDVRIYRHYTSCVCNRIDSELLYNGIFCYHFCIFKYKTNRFYVQNRTFVHEFCFARNHGLLF